MSHVLILASEILQTVGATLAGTLILAGAAVWWVCEKASGALERYAGLFPK